MREIKFRAWDKTKKKMYVFDQTRVNDEYNLLGFHWNEAKEFGDLDLDSSNFELMQFTGLKDRNGKEIFEGDVVKTRQMNRVTDPTDYGMTGLMLSEPQQVRYEQGQFYPIAGWMFPEEMEWEVLGNIYENAELLNKRD